MGRLEDGSCGRCHSTDGWYKPRKDQDVWLCKYCGASAHRIAKRCRRRAAIGGKRGRNSGVHGTAKK